jgi:hypothetical protein
MVQFPAIERDLGERGGCAHYLTRQGRAPVRGSAPTLPMVATLPHGPDKPEPNRSVLGCRWGEPCGSEGQVSGRRRIRKLQRTTCIPVERPNLPEDPRRDMRHKLSLPP